MVYHVTGHYATDSNVPVNVSYCLFFSFSSPTPFIFSSSFPTLPPSSFSSSEPLRLLFVRVIVDISLLLLSPLLHIYVHPFIPSQPLHHMSFCLHFLFQPLLLLSLPAPSFSCPYATFLPSLYPLLSPPPPLLLLLPPHHLDHSPNACYSSTETLPY